MARDESLYDKIDQWVGEGIISAEQAGALKRREAVSAPARRVQFQEILVYLGGLVVFLAMAFLVEQNWRSLGGAGRILSVLVPTALMLASGWHLRTSQSEWFRRAAQALLLSGCLLSAFCFGVTLYELHIIRHEEFLVLVSCVLATGVAGIAFVLLTTDAQSVAFHVCGSATLIALLVWLDETVPPFNHFYENLSVLTICLVFGGLWLALSEWFRTRGRERLADVSQLAGALTILPTTLLLATDEYPAPWHKLTMEVVALLAGIGFIAASVKRQSQIFLYSGAAFLLFLITYVNFEHFEEKIGMPVALLIVGVLLIGIGLGTGRLSKRIRSRKQGMFSHGTARHEGQDVQ